MKQLRRLFLGLLCTAGFSWGAETRPNFVVIICDDLGWGDLAVNGHPQIRTPHLDGLAAAGLRFTSFYAAAPVCSPSRVGLLTGRSPNRAGIFDWIPEVTENSAAVGQSRHLVHLRAEEVTLPRLLQEAGYATAMSGKWHCNSRFNDPGQPQPGDAGFDHWFATQNNAAPSHENPVNFVRNGQAVGPLQGYSCQLVAREATGWLDRQKSQHPDQPFFLYVAFHEPHEPVASPQERVASYVSKARNEDEAQYFANVENMDASVGEVLRTLDRLKVAENTIVLFTSDNGPETLNRYPGARRSYGQPGPLRGMKLWTTDAGVRVPGILRWPARVRAGQLSDQPVSSLDLLPTFTALARGQVPPQLKLDGADLRPLLAGDTFTRKQPLFWVYFNALNEERVALRDGPWKVLAKIEGGRLPKYPNITSATVREIQQAKLTDFALYRISDDIGEATDLAASEPARLQEMSAKLESLYRELATSMHVWPYEPPSAGQKASGKKKKTAP